MKECKEHIIRVGLNRNPKQVFDEVEAVSAAMIREGWSLSDTCLEDGLANIHLLFERFVGAESEENDN